LIKQGQDLLQKNGVGEGSLILCLATVLLSRKREHHVGCCWAYMHDGS